MRYPPLLIALFVAMLLKPYHGWWGSAPAGTRNQSSTAFNYPHTPIITPASSNEGELRSQSCEPSCTFQSTTESSVLALRLLRNCRVVRSRCCWV
jgi:hypothetical protein